MQEPSVPPGSLGPVRFVSDFRYVPGPFAALAPSLLDPGAGWVYTLDADAYEHPEGGGRGTSAVVRIGLAGHRSRLPVVLTAGTPRPREGAVVVPIGWTPLRYSRVLPELDADLELSYVDDKTCRLALTGRYRPPMGTIGQGLDRAGIHGIAESSVRNFLEHVELAILESTRRRDLGSEGRIVERAVEGVGVAEELNVVLEEIPRAECLKLLARTRIGRLGVVDRGQPLVVPVNYAWTPDGILVRTDGGAKLEAGRQHLVALEIDEIDGESHLGWSVLVQGHAFDVTETLDERSERLQAAVVETWAPGPRARRLLVEIGAVSGRRLRTADP